MAPRCYVLLLLFLSAWAKILTWAMRNSCLSSDDLRTDATASHNSPSATLSMICSPSARSMHNPCNMKLCINAPLNQKLPIFALSPKVTSAMHILPTPSTILQLFECVCNRYGGSKLRLVEIPQPNAWAANIDHSLYADERRLDRSVDFVDCQICPTQRCKLFRKRERARLVCRFRLP